MGRPAKNGRHARAIHRAQFADRLTRALSVAIPVFAYIWRYNFEISRKIKRALSDFTTVARAQMLRTL